MQKHFVTDYSMCCSKRFVFSCVSFTFSDSFLFGGGIVYLFNGSRPFFSILLWLSRAHCVRTHMQRRRRWQCQSFAAYSCYFSLSHSLSFALFCANPNREHHRNTYCRRRCHQRTLSTLSVCVCTAQMLIMMVVKWEENKKVLCLFLCERTPIRCMHM